MRNIQIIKIINQAFQSKIVGAYYDNGWQIKAIN